MRIPLNAIEVSADIAVGISFCNNYKRSMSRIKEIRALHLMDYFS